MSVKVISKRVARLAAVQFMYQLEVTNKSALNSLENFISTYIKTHEIYEHINLRFFKKLAAYFSERENLDEIIAKNLNGEKKISHLSIVEISILKVAMIEMINFSTDLPIIINEYVEIAKEFFEAPRMLNALLDSISKNIERKCQQTAV